MRYWSTCHIQRPTLLCFYYFSFWFRSCNIYDRQGKKRAYNLLSDFLWILYKHQLPITCRLTINFDFNIDCMSTFLSQFSDFFLPAVVYPQHVCEYSVLFFSIQTVKLTVQLQFCSPSVSQLGYHCGTFTAQTYWKRIQFSPSSSSSADCLHWYSCYGTARVEYLEDNFEPW